MLWSKCSRFYLDDCWAVILLANRRLIHVYLNHMSNSFDLAIWIATLWRLDPLVWWVEWRCTSGVRGW